MSPALLREVADLFFVEAVSGDDLPPSAREHLFASARALDTDAALALEREADGEGADNWLGLDDLRRCVSG